MRGLILAQIQKYLTEEPRVKPVVRLYLRFDEHIRAVAASRRRDEDAIQPEGSLLDFFGAKDIAFGRILKAS